MQLESRVVLVTGAKRIGGDVARAVAARGADVVVAYRSSDTEALKVVADVGALGRRGLAVQADLQQPDEPARLVMAAERAFGRLDVLVNMASLYEAVPFEKLDVAEWDRQLAVDLRASFLCAQAAAPLMRRAGGGRIVNFTDWVAASGRPRYRGYSAYYVAKAGVVALTEVLALELAPDILVNAIAPGPILAPEGTSSETSDAVVRATPLGRWGGSNEIVKAVLALVESDFMTGQTIRVDGGRHVH